MASAWPLAYGESGTRNGGPQDVLESPRQRGGGQGGGSRFPVDGSLRSLRPPQILPQLGEGEFVELAWLPPAHSHRFAVAARVGGKEGALSRLDQSDGHFSICLGAGP